MRILYALALLATLGLSAAFLLDSDDQGKADAPALGESRSAPGLPPPAPSAPGPETTKLRPLRTAPFEGDASRPGARELGGGGEQGESSESPPSGASLSVELLASIARLRLRVRSGGAALYSEDLEALVLRLIPLPEDGPWGAGEQGGPSVERVPSGLQPGAEASAVSFEVHGLRRSQPTIQVDGGGFLRSATPVMAVRSGEVRTIVIDLQRGVNLSGVITSLGREERPLAGAFVQYRRADGGTWHAITDTAGRYRLEGLAGGKGSLRVSAREHRAIERALSLRLPASGRQGAVREQAQDLGLLLKATLQVTALNARGEALAGREVSLVPLDRELAAEQVAQRRRMTNAQGHALWHEPPFGRWEVRLESAHGSAAHRSEFRRLGREDPPEAERFLLEGSMPRREVIIEAGKPIQVVLQELPPAQLRVRLVGFHQGFAGVSVVVQAVDSAETMTRAASASGVVGFEGLEGGRYRLTLTRAGYADDWRELLLPPGAAREVVWHLPDVSFYGRVVDAVTGDPVSGAEVVFGKRGQGLPAAADRFDSGPFGSLSGGSSSPGDGVGTDSEGAFVRSQLSEGEGYAVSIAHPGYVKLEVEVKAGRPTRSGQPLLFSLTPAAQIEVHLRRPSWTVSLYRQEGGVKGSRIASRDHQDIRDPLIFRGLAPGSYVLSTLEETGGFGVSPVDHGPYAVVAGQVLRVQID